jgi:ribosomal protein S18 acetylase RimI-like enzyme
MYVRSFQLSDYAAVTALLQDSLCDECYDETMEAFARQLSWDSELIIVAEKNREIAGIVIGTIDNNRAYYYRIAVHPAHRRQGIGRSMIQSLKFRFQQRKVSKILVTVDNHNEPVLPLYESLGYSSNDFSHSIQKLSIVNG